MLCFDIKWSETPGGTTKTGHLGIIYYKNITKSYPPNFQRLVMDFTPSYAKNVGVIMINYLKSLGLKPNRLKHAIKSLKR